MTHNLGLLYSKEYFNGLTYSYDGKKLTTEDSTKSIAKNNEVLFGALFSDEIKPIENAFTFSLKTTYPGLFTGSGYQHSVEGNDEFKIGFFFDFTSGQPLLPGSSVKGALRSVFPGSGKKNKAEKVQLIQYFFKEILKLEEPSPDQVKAIEEEIFAGKRNGERINLYKTDIFYDAVLSSTNLNKKFLGNDYITPHHENPLRNPTPLQFLKILPEIEFEFRFKVNDSTFFPALTKEKKCNLFKAILLFRGIGAKTNVGYGQFDLTDDDKARLKAEEAKRVLELEQERLEALQNDPNYIRTQKLTNGSTHECYVFRIDKDNCYFKFDWDNNYEFSKKLSKIQQISQLSDNTRLKIKLGQSYQNNIPLNFSIEEILPS